MFVHSLPLRCNKVLEVISYMAIQYAEYVDTSLSHAYVILLSMPQRNRKIEYI